MESASYNSQSLKRLKTAASSVSSSVNNSYANPSPLIMQMQPNKIENSFTDKYFDQLQRAKEQRAFLATQEELKRNTDNLNMIQASVTIDIKKDFPSDKEYNQYMESRLSGMFFNPNDPENSIGNAQDDSNKYRKGFLQWQEDEKDLFIQLLKKHGRDWTAISNELPRKTDKQCRNYFQNYKKKYNFHQYLNEKSK